MTQEGMQLLGGGAIGGAAITAAVFMIGARQRATALAAQMQQQRKDQFISLASHYLLNPITVIQTAISSLQEKGTKATAEEREDLYSAVERGQQRLWIFVQQIILVSEIDTKTLKPQIGVANLEDMVTAAVGAVDAFARVKKVRIHVINNLNDVREARFDARRLKQAVIALVDNAVKFSLEEGEVTVTIGFEKDIFSIKVEDAGIGMPDEVMAHITEKFYRGTDSYTFDYEGVGLGLHTAQAIVRMHEGNLSITSKPQRGTVAVIQFPDL